VTGIVRVFACGLFTACAVSFLAGSNCAPQVSCTLMGNCPSTTPTPTISPDGGTFAGSVAVTIACADPTATIFYTTDGSEPNAASSAYGGAIILTNTTTLRARAIRSGFNASGVAWATFTISGPPATFSWQMLGTGIGGLAPRVFALAVYNDELIAGGRFSFAATGGIAETVARWDGTTWRPLAGGIGGTSAPSVSALAVYNGELIAGGDFEFNTGAGFAYNIARWNGANWATLGAGTEFEVQSLAVHDGILYVGGIFTTAGGGQALRVARWNGSSWAPLGSGTDGAVSALASASGELFAGGVFSMAGGLMTSRIARWNGSVWNMLGTGLDQRARALTSYHGEAVVGGDFTQAGGNPASRIARWNGTTWQTLGAGCDGTVFALAGYEGDLVAGGSFSSPAARVARWNGLAWQSIGGGLLNSVFALTSFRGQLIAGGGVSEAGIGVLSDQPIARWAPIP